LPSLDYAGGGPVHIASGVSALAYALVLGKRKIAGEKIHKKPHNTTLVFLGTIMIWFGWLAFNVRDLSTLIILKPAADNRIGRIYAQHIRPCYDGML
jgi:ammonia channel protein AmtB